MNLKARRGAFRVIAHLRLELLQPRERSMEIAEENLQNCVESLVLPERAGVVRFQRGAPHRLKCLRQGALLPKQELVSRQAAQGAALGAGIACFARQQSRCLEESNGLL